MNRFLTMIAGAIVILSGLSVLFGTWYTIDQGTRGVILRNGALLGIAQPGLGFKLPLIDTVQKTSVQTHVETEVQRLRQNANREKVQAEITVTQANARANGVRAQAQAETDSIRLKDEAEATAIRARVAALGENPNLVTLVQAERWNGILATTMVPGAAVPMISVSR
ncbi:SPFH domain-containing protein [uncultured Enterovirga sp.]|uniref:SPFH domain-containing protein n=1 Tax=uncultured Enterovirga sp. TaxID=2026352 RepID=UPI0035CBEE24